MENERREHKDSDLPAGLSQPALRALHGAGCWRLEQLTTLKESEVKRMHGIGPKALAQLRHALSVRSLSFADEQSGTGK